MKRRSLLASTATVLLGVSTAGCMELLTQSTGTTDSDCAPGYRELDQTFPDSIPSDAPNGLSLSLSTDTATPPEPVTATLKNTGDSAVEVYATDRLAIQWRNSEGDWTNTLGVPRDYRWSSNTTTLKAKAARDWQFRLERGGFPEPYERCTSFVPGTYRFVYWGRPDEQPLAAPFEVTET